MHECQDAVYYCYSDTEVTMSSARVRFRILHSTLCRDVILLSQSLQKKLLQKIINGQTKLLRNLHVNNTLLLSMHVCTYIDERGINIVSVIVSRQYDTWVIIWNIQETHLVIICIKETSFIEHQNIKSNLHVTAFPYRFLGMLNERFAISQLEIRPVGKSWNLKHKYQRFIKDAVVFVWITWRNQLPRRCEQRPYRLDVSSAYQLANEDILQQTLN